MKENERKQKKKKRRKMRSTGKRKSQINNRSGTK
jgi:hypothetical protein